MVMSTPVWDQGFLPTLSINDIATVGTVFNVFSYDAAVLSRDSNFSPSRKGRAEAQNIEPSIIFLKPSIGTGQVFSYF